MACLNFGPWSLDGTGPGMLVYAAAMCQTVPLPREHGVSPPCSRSQLRVVRNAAIFDFPFGLSVDLDTELPNIGLAEYWAILDRAIPTSAPDESITACRDHRRGYNYRAWQRLDPQR